METPAVFGREIQEPGKVSSAGTNLSEKALLHATLPSQAHLVALEAAAAYYLKKPVILHLNDLVVAMITILLFAII